MNKYILLILKVIFISSILGYLIFIFAFQNKKNMPQPKINLNVPEKITKAKKTSHRGIYITEYVAKSPHLFNPLKEQSKKCGLDTMVIDAKSTLSKPLLGLLKNHQLNNETQVSADIWLANITKDLHDSGFIVTVRLVVFKDDLLVLYRPDLAVKMLGDKIYRDNIGGRWADPYSLEVRLFNELVAERAALSGVDEIQFDYLRFPTDGKMNKVYYSHKVKDMSKVVAINTFLKGVRQRVSRYNVSLAADIFGITAWQSKIDVKNLGQDIKTMAKYIDVISPMLYPSHFHKGYDGYANPGAHPYHFIYAGVNKTQEILATESVKIVPWIQGFNLHSPGFGPMYITEQIKAVQDAGINSFLIWNAANVYKVSFKSLAKSFTNK